MEFRKTMLSVAVVLIMTGCSSISTSFDYDRDVDFGKYATYTWMQNDKMARSFPFFDKRLKAAINKEMFDRGLKEHKDNPDLLITYAAAVQEKISGTTTTGYHGWYGWGGGYTTVNTYNEGTLIIDIVDYEQNQLIWRGWATSAVDREPDDDDITFVVEKILRTFPPQPEDK